MKHKNTTVIVLATMLAGVILADSDYQLDNFVLKLTDGKTVTITRGNDGLFEYGIASIDQLNDNYGVTVMEKMFVDEPGNSGLAQYYRVIFSEARSDIESVADTYINQTDVHFVALETVPELLLITRMIHYIILL